MSSLIPTIPTRLILRTHALLSLATSYILLTRPSAVSSQMLLTLLGDSMRLPPPQGAFLRTPNPACALAAFFLAVLAISDFFSTTIEGFAYDEYWSLQTLVRTLVFATCGVATYVVGRDTDGQPTKNWFAPLANDVVFGICFVEMSIFYWMYVTLKSEREATAKEIMAKQEREQELKKAF